MAKEIVTTEFDAALYLTDEDMIAAYLAEAMETGDVEFIAHCEETIVRARENNASNVARMDDRTNDASQTD